MQVTFHPKIYLFEGPQRAEMFIGSSNLTVGGTETNAEGTIRLTYDMTVEAAAWQTITAFWPVLLKDPNAAKVSAALIADLDAEGLLLDESVIHTPSKAGGGAGKIASKKLAALFPFTPIQSASASPKPIKRQAAAAKGIAIPAAAVAAAAAIPAALPRTLLIQIAPHHNGEIFLSKLAVNEYPKFFGFPFTGTTVPKKASNPPYPQRAPDPVTDWTIYSKAGKVSRVLRRLGLNTVYYKTKGEIRITVSPDVAGDIPAQSILEMTQAPEGSGLDYVCEVFPPGSPQYAGRLKGCTKTMPSGGKAVARRYGWV